MNKLELNEKKPLTNREKEIYRTLRTNIEFTGVENRVLTVTSCIPSDGKTTVSYNLAASFAEAGKNTLLIDADMRKSIFMERFGIQANPKGLSHLLSGQAVLQDVIYSTNKKKLFILPTGVFPSNPTELLGNGRLEQTLKVVKDTFDYVIVDTPPLGAVVDAALIAKCCDASCLVINADHCPRGTAKNVIAQLKNANPNFLGVILNRVNFKTNRYYGKGYGGYYGKGYGSYYGKEE